MGSSDRVRSKVDASSHGNQQRVQLAAALLHGPEVLILDEPLAGLDPTGIDAIGAVLVEQARAGCCVLFSSHQLDQVEDLCESVTIIDHGRLVVTGNGGRPGSQRPAPAGGARGRGPGRRLGRKASRASRVSEVDAGAARLVLDDVRGQRSVLRAAMAAGRVTEFVFERRRLSEVFREAIAMSHGSSSAVVAVSPGRAGCGAVSGAEQQASKRPRPGLGPFNGDVGLVAAREMRERFRGRIFRVGTLLVLAAVAAAIVIPTLDKQQVAAPTGRPRRQSPRLGASSRGELGLERRHGRQVRAGKRRRTAPRQAFARGRIDLAIESGHRARGGPSRSAANDTSTTAQFVLSVASNLGVLEALRSLAHLTALRKTPTLAQCKGAPDHSLQRAASSRARPRPPH